MSFITFRGRQSLAGLNALALAAGILGGGLTLTVAPDKAMACNSEPYIGTICTFAFNYCPNGYLPANGSQVSIQTNVALFSLLGTIYGGNGTTTFALPDLRSRTAIGAGQPPGLNGTQLGMITGQQSVTLTGQNLPPHTHPAIFAGSGGGGSQTVTVPAVPSTLAVSATLQGRQATGTGALVPGAYLGQGGTGTGSANIYVDPNSQAPQAALGGLSASLSGSPGNPEITFSVNSGITGGTVTVQPNPSSNLPISTQSPGLGLTQCIAAVGLFPPRP